MTAIKLVPITLDVAMELLGMLRSIRQHPAFAKRLGEPGLPDPARLASITTTIGEAISIAGEHESDVEMLCAELLGLIGRVSGRALSTIPGKGSLAAAEEALSEMGPVLGNVLHLPRAANTDAKALDAAVARGLADMPGPISMRVWVQTLDETARLRDGDYVEHDAVDVWTVPRERELWCGHRIVGVEWDSPSSVRLFLKANPPEDTAF